MAAAAKALAGRAALLACTHGQQLCGAIGFTIEHPMPGLVARAHLLDTFLGSAALLAGTLGEAVLAGHLERPYPIHPDTGRI
jgi:alkylation response protein AidB-like acyl-CoA dehydrogenase